MSVASACRTMVRLAGWETRLVCGAPMTAYCPFSDQHPECPRAAASSHQTQKDEK